MPSHHYYDKIWHDFAINFTTEPLSFVKKVPSEIRYFFILSYSLMCTCIMVKTCTFWVPST